MLLSHPPQETRGMVRGNGKRLVFLNSLSTANRMNFNSKQRNSDSQDGVCQLLPHVPRRMLVKKICTCLQGSHRIQGAISRDTLYQISLLTGRYVAQKNNESIYRAFSRWPYWCCKTGGKELTRVPASNFVFDVMS